MPITNFTAPSAPKFESEEQKAARLAEAQAKAEAQKAKEAALRAKEAARKLKEQEKLKEKALLEQYLSKLSVPREDLLYDDLKPLTCQEKE